eukprot:gb/GECG01012098.1/.p1 GENE.gb/GECG01012098.1/~~gb/GECG01012098.1/.p1  ORF type:complete len:345 (+),score=38.08 gb/GECG01012098.1/:1-1035(+)
MLAFLWINGAKKAHLAEILQGHFRFHGETMSTKKIQQRARGSVEAAPERTPDDIHVREPGEDDPSSRVVRIAYFESDDFFEASESSKRAVREAVEALKQQPNVEFVEQKPPSTYEACCLYYSLMSPEGGMKAFLDGLDGEDLHPLYSALYSLANVPNWAKPVAAKILNSRGEPRVARLLQSTGPLSTWEYWKRLQTRKLLLTALIRWWEDANLDALVCPATGLPALKHTYSSQLTPSCSYTFLWNLFDFPAGVVPVTEVRDTEAEQQYVPPECQQDRFSKQADESIRGAAGCPVGVQVVGLPFQDEKVLGLMKVLQDSLPGSPHRLTPDVEQYMVKGPVSVSST